MTCFPSGPQYVGDPVNVVTGANTEVAFEFRLAGPERFLWRRYYNSRDCTWQRALGWGHTHECDHRLKLDLDGILYSSPAGERIEFEYLSQDGQTTRNGGYRLTRLEARIYELRLPRSQARLTFSFRSDSFRGGAWTAYLTQLRNADGTLHFEYDERGLAQIRLGPTRHISVLSDSYGRLVSLTLFDEAERSPQMLIAYAYDFAGNLVEGTDRYQHRFSFEYDEHNRLVRKTDRRGYSMLFAYDGEGRCIRAGGEDGVAEVRLRYLKEERLTIVTEADGGEWTYFFNEIGQITLILNPVGGARRFEFDKAGVLQSETDPLGNVTRYVYDSDGEAIAKVNPIGVRYGLNETPPPPYRPHRVASSAYQFEFGDLAFLPSNTPSDTTSSFWADARIPGRIIRVLSQPLPERLNVVSDAFSQRLKEPLATGQARRWAYDANGNTIRYRDFSGADYFFEHASWNHRVRDIDPEGNAVQYRFTKKERLAAVIDGGGTEQRYSYNTLGEVSEVYRHGELLEMYEYDPAGNLVQKRDRSGTVLLRFEIAPTNQIGARHLASGDSHQFEYDTEGRILRANSQAGAVQFAYDGAGRRIRDMRDGRGVEHRYDWDGSETFVLGRFKVQYARRSDGSIRVTSPAGEIHSLSSPRPNLLLREHSSGSWEYIRFDDRGRVHTKVAQQRQTTGDRWVRKYQWSPDGDLLAAEDNHLGSHHWEYDRAHRLKNVRLPNGSYQKLAYDGGGNLLEAPRLAGVSLHEGNRLATANGARFEYNERDHIAKRVGLDGTYSYSYDSRGMLARIEKNGEPYFEASYDALGRRGRKTVAGRTTEYFWDTDRLAAEVDATGRLRVYVYWDALALSPFLFLDYRSVDADPASGSTYVVFSNQLGAPLVIEDAKGRIVWQGSSTAYGMVHLDAVTSIEYNLRFPGHHFDPETGLHYNRFRYYSPELGRYLQCDPEGIRGGLNLYAYTSNPLIAVDVRGLTCSIHPDETVPDCEDCQNADKAKQALSLMQQPQGPSAFPGLQRGGGKTDVHIDRVADVVNDDRTPVNKNRSITVIEHADGSVSVGLSGNDPKRTANSQSVVDTLNQQYPNNPPTYSTSGPVDATGLLDAGSPANPAPLPGTCSEAQAAQAARANPSPPQAYQTVWSGPKSAPSGHQLPGGPTTSGGHEQMQPCPTCQANGNAKNYLP